MVQVKIYGVARLKAGVGTFERDASTADELLGMIPNITKKEAKDLVLLVNGKPAGRHTCRLKDGDEVVLLAPAGGG